MLRKQWYRRVRSIALLPFLNPGKFYKLFSKHDSESQIDILLLNIFSDVHLCMRLSHSHNGGYVIFCNCNALSELEEKMIEFKNTENQIEQTYDYKSTFTKIKVMNSSKVPSEQYAR